MAKLSNTLLLKQQQKLTAIQIQLMNLIQLPAMALEQRIKEEIEANPLLEEDEQIPENTDEQTEPQDDENEINDIDDYLQDDDQIPYKLHQEGQKERNEDNLFVSYNGFREDLISQLGVQNLTDEQKIMGNEIIGNLDSSGYLARSLEAICDDILFRYNLEVSKREIEQVLAVIQSFEPAGIAARDLKECLILQINRMKDGENEISLAKNILTRCFSAFSNKHYQIIMQKLGCSEGELKAAIGKIVALNPKPANTQPELMDKISIVPDYILWSQNGIVEFTLNKVNDHRLKLNTFYQNMLVNLSQDRKTNSETIKFIKTKLDSAKIFIDALERREDTLTVTMQSIIDFQGDYFLKGDVSKLKPMKLIDISEKIGLDLSTVSRVVNNKYVQTHFGTFKLRHFFSNSMINSSGEAISTESVRAIITESIENEDKQQPLTDEQLLSILKNRGFNIARRTIAKYRETMNIPVARLRRAVPEKN
ncbi:MAG: RNA polymerase factor sigma-54 [Bacteroidales bacterium]|jgi:RNA polymerase sigma-54 factor|nr:RNA polymerase factor sigma-54 [Bacteroidales bacterium]